jgi:raffinose/stachyose/melibiose transport system substrate-binding protein
MQKKYAISLIFLVSTIFIYIFFSGNNYNHDLIFLNSNPLYQEKFELLAKEYEYQTGVKIKVVSAPLEVPYMETLKEHLNLRDAPTIFSIENVANLNHLLEYDKVLDLSLSQSVRFAIFEDSIPSNLKLNVYNGSSFGVPYSIEGAGFIVNTSLLHYLFEGDIYQLVEDLKNSTYYEFEAFVIALDNFINYDISSSVVLNSRVYTMHEEKTGLAKYLQGVFSVLSSDVLVSNSLFLSIPVNSVFSSHSSILGATNAQIRQLYQPLRTYARTLDLITTFMTSYTGPVSRNTNFNVADFSRYDSLYTFANNKSVFIAESTSSYMDIVNLNPQMSDNLEIIPIKLILTDDDIAIDNLTSRQFNSSLPIFVPNYFAINNNVSEEKQDMAKEFILWLHMSDFGVNFILNEFNFIPFLTTYDSSQYLNSLSSSVFNYMYNNTILEGSLSSAPVALVNDIYLYLKYEFLTNEVLTSNHYDDFANFAIQKWLNLLD